MRREHNIQPLLPTGYRQLEYLESTGTQYINTGVNADTNTEVEVVVKFTQIFNDNTIIGMDAGSYLNKAFCLEYSTPLRGIVTCFGQNAANEIPQTGVVPTAYNKYEIKTSKQGMYVNGTLYPFLVQHTSFSCPYPLFAFCYGRNGGVALGGKVRIHYLKIGNSGTLQRDFLPALRISDNKPGLYDLVNNQFFTNAGTGEFLYN